MPEVLRPHADMSDYEAAAWRRLIERVGRREKRRRQLRPIKKVQELTEAAAEKVEAMLEDHARIKAIVDGMGAPLSGLQDLLVRGAATSVSSNRLLKRAGRRDAAIRSLSDLRNADLQVPDKLLANHTLAYGAAMAVEGAGTSLLITGAVVSSTVTGGTTMAVAAAAVATDVSANLGAAARVVAKIALTYGYDATLPDERLYALGVLNYGTSLTATGKLASLGQLSKLTQTMMRGATHATLDKFVLVKVTKEFFRLLGFRLTRQRLAQMIPFAGIALNAGINAQGIIQLSERAQELYRLRFLTEKYELDAAAWLSRVEQAVPDGEQTDAIDLDQIIEDAEQGPQDGG